MAKVLMKGNEAIGEAAIRAGCIHFFGYPITPQSEVPEYLARRLPDVGGIYLQAESEVAASNMIYGAAGVGVRVMTSSSSPGVSLMAEGLSYIAACELPVVLVNIMRAGPGLGTREDGVANAEAPSSREGPKRCIFNFTRCSFTSARFAVVAHPALAPKTDASTEYGLTGA